MNVRNTWGPPTTAVVITGSDLLNKPIGFGGMAITPAVNDTDCQIFLVPDVALGSYTITIDGQPVTDFQVIYPASNPRIDYLVTGPDFDPIMGGHNWYTIIGDQFYAGNTTITISGVEYIPSVMSPTECAVVLDRKPITLTLTTPIGSVTYP